MMCARILISQIQQCGTLTLCVRSRSAAAPAVREAAVTAVQDAPMKGITGSLLLIAAVAIVFLPIAPLARGQVAAASRPAELTVEIERTDQEILRLYRLGRLREATELARKQLDLRRRHLGPEHTSTLDAMAMLGLLLKLQDQCSEAESLQRRVLTIKRRTLGEEHADTLALINNLATLFMAQGKLSEAEPLYRRVLETRRRLLGDEDRETLISLHNLAMLLRKRGAYAEAEPLFREALNTKRRVLGEEHESTLTSMAGLAVCYCEQGRYSESEPLLREILKTRRRVFGEEHLRVADSLNNLGVLLQRKGDYAAAETMQYQALEIRQHALGDDHSSTVGSKNNLASVLKGCDRHAEAEVLYREALEANRHRLGEEHPGTLSSKNNLASVLVAQGRDSEAEPLSRFVLETRRKVLGVHHPDTLRAADNHAVLLCRAGKVSEAEPILRDVLAVRQRTLGNNHPDTLTSMNHLAQLLYAQEQYAEAQQVWENAAAAFESARLSVSVSGLERTRFTMEHSPLLPLACCLARRGKCAEAWCRFERGIARGLVDTVHADQARALTAQERLCEKDLVAKLTELDEQLHVISQGERPQAQELARELGWQRRALQAEYVAFEKGLEDRYGPAAGEVWTLSQVQAQLPATAAIVAWVDIQVGSLMLGSAENHWACVVRSRGDPIWKRLSGLGPAGEWTEDDRQLPAQMRQALVDPGTPAGVARSRATALYSQRLQPLEPYLADVDTLVVVPFGPMAGIPVEALTDAYAVSYAPSATMFAWLAQRPRRPLRKLLAVGDPPHNEAQLREMEQPSSEQLHATVPIAVGYDKVASSVLRDAVGGNREALSKLPRLPATRTETIATAQLFRQANVRFRPAERSPQRDNLATVLLGRNASEQALADLVASDGLRQFDGLHFAVHALADDRQQALVLSQVDLPDPLEAVIQGQPVYDGLLSVEQIVRTWRLDAELVTLSACRTALGHEAGSMGHLGFSQAFLVAGARSLLLSLWEIDDSVAALMMVRFYQNLLGEFTDVRDGYAPGAEIPKAEALREARQWLRGLTHAQARTECVTLGVPLPGAVSRGEPGQIRAVEHSEHPFEHPHYWAGFILVGKTD